MKKLPLIVLAVSAVTLCLIGCGAPAANTASNSANKPANAAPAPAADKAAVEGDLKKMMTDFAAALNKGDADALGKMYSDDYTLIDANGSMVTKAARVEAIKSGKVKMEGLKFDDLKIKTNPTGDGAVITGHVTGKTTADGKTEESNSMVTWVVAKMKDKGWQFVNAQITNIKSGTPPPKSDEKPKDEASAPASNK